MSLENPKFSSPKYQNKLKIKIKCSSYFLWVTCSDCADHYVQNGGCDNANLNDASSEQILDDACMSCEESAITSACSSSDGIFTP